MILKKMVPGQLVVIPNRLSIIMKMAMAVAVAAVVATTWIVIDESMNQNKLMIPWRLNWGGGRGRVLGLDGLGGYRIYEVGEVGQGLQAKIRFEPKHSVPWRRTKCWLCWITGHVTRPIMFNGLMWCETLQISFFRRAFKLSRARE